MKATPKELTRDDMLDLFTTSLVNSEYFRRDLADFTGKPELAELSDKKLEALVRGLMQG